MNCPFCNIIMTWAFNYDKCTTCNCRLYNDKCYITFTINDYLYQIEINQIDNYTNISFMNYLKIWESIVKIDVPWTITEGRENIKIKLQKILKLKAFL